MFRHLQEFEALFESEGIDALIGPDGTIYSIFDLRRLYDKRYELLTLQRARAIEFFLYLDLREQDAAEAMGLSRETPVAIYATQGLRQLAAVWDEGILWGRGPLCVSGEEADAVPADADAPEERDLQGAGV